MAKTSGGVRTLKTGSREYKARELEAKRMMDSGKYSSVEFSKKGGGYVAVEKSSAKHKPEELEAAKFLADKGYKVILIDESIGTMKTPDGKVFSYYYEQTTPNGYTKENFRNQLNHAKDKNADIALVYMKYNTHTKQSVVDGLKDYERRSKYRFKQIIIVTADGRIHRHKHN